jgi:hypothetical protein
MALDPQFDHRMSPSVGELESNFHQSVSSRESDNKRASVSPGNVAAIFVADVWQSAMKSWKGAGHRAGEGGYFKCA